ncbi:MAG: endonuclease domain-containing protein [Patescibacteria group bacterium]
MSMEQKRQIFSANRMLYRRRDLRLKSTLAEKLLWEKLRRKGLGFKFKRQFSVDNYVIDFYCPDRKLAIELDGEIHKQRKEYDEYRTKYIKAFGITEIRFSNKEISEDLGKAVKRIFSLLRLGERIKERG